MKKDLFKHVDDSKDTWSIHAKVLRKWVVRRKTAPFHVWKVGMILVDEELTRVEVVVTHRSLLERYQGEPHEGMVYNFKNFEVVENEDQFRVTSHKWRFNFHPNTYIEESDVEIPGQAYNFADISDILNQITTNEGLVDVIGFLQSFGRLQDVRRERDTIKKLNLAIADRRENTITVSLWGSCAEETYQAKTEDMEPPIIILIRFARINENSAYSHVSNTFTATKVFFNPELQESKLLLESLSQESTGSQLFSQISDADNHAYSNVSLLSFRTRIRIKDISNIEEECDVVTRVTLQKAETLYGWMYESCPCNKKPECLDNGTLKCLKCDKEVLMTVPKFKVHFKVFDDTGKCSLLFFDRYVTELVGKSAAQMKKELHKTSDASSFPEELDKVRGKIILVKLRVKDHNIKHRSNSIVVTQMCNDKELVHSFTYSDGEVCQPKNVEIGMEESSASNDTKNVGTSLHAADDADPTTSQLFTPPEVLTKGKKSSRLIDIDAEDICLSDLSTPRFSTNKHVMNIKKEN